MNLRSKLARVAALLFSLTLLAGYVVYSHITPNMPPPDPLGLNQIESSQEPDASGFDDTGKAETVPSSPERPRNDLRIISSKVINQPVFRVPEPKRAMTMPEVRVATADFKVSGFRMVKELEVVPGPGVNTATPFDSFLSPTPDPLQQSVNIQRILKDNGSGAAGSGRRQTPESLSADYFRALQMRRMMMSGSKSGVVRFDPPSWPGEPVLPHNLAPTVTP